MADRTIGLIIKKGYMFMIWAPGWPAFISLIAGYSEEFPTLGINGMNLRLAGRHGDINNMRRIILGFGFTRSAFRLGPGCGWLANIYSATGIYDRPGQQ
jgi:hypothetical protein